jgi:DeoR/GlpR family transcriptional regulator of sugar metabolism
VPSWVWFVKKFEDFIMLCGEAKLIVSGGQCRQCELSMVGLVAEQAIREFRGDLMLMGMRAIDARHGSTSDYVAEAMTDRAILHMAPHCAVMADHTKSGRVSTVFIAPVTAVQCGLHAAAIGSGPA